MQRLVVEIDNTVGTAKQRHSGTNLDARRVVAVITAQHRKVTPRVGIYTLLDVLDPSTINSHRNIVFFFTGDGASVTTDAAMLIDEKSVTHYKPFRLTT